MSKTERKSVLVLRKRAGAVVSVRSDTLLSKTLPPSGGSAVASRARASPSIATLRFHMPDRKSFADPVKGGSLGAGTPRMPAGPEWGVPLGFPSGETAVSTMAGEFSKWLVGSPSILKRRSFSLARSSLIDAGERPFPFQMLGPLAYQPTRRTANGL